MPVRTAGVKKFVSTIATKDIAKTVYLVLSVSTIRKNAIVQIAEGIKDTIGCRTTGNRKLNGYCSHCLVHIFPEDPRALTVRKKSKELQVLTYIFSKHEGFKNDKLFM